MDSVNSIENTDNNIQKINVRGVNFFNVDMNEAINIAKGYINSSADTPNVIYTPNSEMVQACIEDKDTGGKLFDIINSASMIIPDGAGVVLASKILGTPLKEKVAGIELAYSLIEYLDEIGGRLFLLGSKDDIVKTAKEKLNAKYKNLVVCGVNGGFFNQNTDSPFNQAVVEKINQSKPNVVFVCLGVPKQEIWIYENRHNLNAKLLIGLGGTIDDIAGVVKRAPKIFIKLNLEWFYRLIKNPTRLSRMMKLPKFIFGTYFSFLVKKEK